MYVYICICTHICTYIYTCIRICIHIYICMYITWAMRQTASCASRRVPSFARKPNIPRADTKKSHAFQNVALSCNRTANFDLLLMMSTISMTNLFASPKWLVRWLLRAKYFHGQRICVSAMAGSNQLPPTRKNPTLS